MNNPEYEVIPDQFHRLRINGGEYEYMLSTKWDRFDYVPGLDHWSLRVLDDETGLNTVHLNQEYVSKILGSIAIPICPRPVITESEYKDILNFKATLLEDPFED